MRVPDVFDRQDAEDNPEPNEDGVTCKRCGVSGLEWRDTGVRWRLYDANVKPHVCSNEAAADDFEVLDE